MINKHLIGLLMIVIWFIVSIVSALYMLMYDALNKMGITLPIFCLLLALFVLYLSIPVIGYILMNYKEEGEKQNEQN